MKKTLSLILFAALALGCTGNKAIHKDAKMDQFIDALMKKMTLEEKAGQLNLPVAGDIVTGEGKTVSPRAR